MKKKIFLNFDFYGAGNIGDDMMLEGFLRGMGYDNYEFYCYVPKSRDHIRRRFNRVNFVSKEEKDKTEKICPVWIGAGDTPIQVKSGDWFIDKLVRDNEIKKQSSIRYYFIGIGAEKEAEVKKDVFREILIEVDHIWTRDMMTYDFLKEKIGTDKGKLTYSSDLANIFLHEVFGVNNEISKEKKFDIGICYYDESPDSNDGLIMKRFLIKNFKRNKCILICNDVNVKGNFEFSVYRKMFSKTEKLLKMDIKVLIPEYYTEYKTNNLVSHYGDCELIMTSRYHALLTAAWAGCKVISLERSSKVTALANELGIFEIKKPFNEDKLKQSLSKAVKVDRNKLIELYKKSLASVKELSQMI